MSDNVLIALITTLGGGGSIIVAAFKILPEIINSRRTKKSQLQQHIEAANKKLDNLTEVLKKLTDLTLLSLEVHKVELKGLKQGGLNGDCEVWSKKIDDATNNLVKNALQVS